MFNKKQTVYGALLITLMATSSLQALVKNKRLTIIPRRIYVENKTKKTIFVRLHTAGGSVYTEKVRPNDDRKIFSWHRGKLFNVDQIAITENLETPFNPDAYSNPGWYVIDIPSDRQGRIIAYTIQYNGPNNVQYNDTLIK